MYINIATFKVQAEHHAAFTEALIDNASNSVQQEAGCLRFDVLQDESDPNTIYVYEVFRDKADLEAHHETAHSRRWRAAYAWLAAPIVAHRCFNIFPTDDNW